jgi:UDP-N-acetylglucosamine 2-epimerase (non-hydrolysing)
MKRIGVFIGTRPEAIKMAPVIAAIQASEGFRPIVVNTGQHRELINQVIELFDIEVEQDLAVMEPNQTLAGLTGRLLVRVDDVLERIQPHMALVQGDTTTVLATALAAFYRQIPVGHVEAGLRTGNLRSPFPEEANRRLTTPVVTLHFSPTNESAENLRREGVDPATIHVTGNTVVDALFLELERQSQPSVRLGLHRELGKQIGEGYPDRPVVLITGHRRENFGAGFDQICTALAVLARRFADHQFIYPVHLNPHVKAVVHERLASAANIHLLEPQPYDRFVSLMAGCRLILTDSGGVQEEAPSLGKPVLVMRDTTERPEGVAAGTVRLVGAVAGSIVAETERLLTDERAYAEMANAVNPYGDGQAAPRIVAAIEAWNARTG